MHLDGWLPAWFTSPMSTLRFRTFGRTPLIAAFWTYDSGSRSILSGQTHSSRITLSFMSTGKQAVGPGSHLTCRNGGKRSYWQEEERVDSCFRWIMSEFLPIPRRFNSNALFSPRCSLLRSHGKGLHSV